VAFSPDGKTIFTRCTDRTTREWDAGTGNPLTQPLADQQSSKSTAPSSAGDTAPIGGDDTRTRPPDISRERLSDPTRSRERARRSVTMLPDGETFVAVDEDGRAWFLDAASNYPIGPPLTNQGSARAPVSAYPSPDGRIVLIGDPAWKEEPGETGLLRLWKVPDLPDDFPRIAAWVAVLTGLELDEHGDSRPIDHAAWQQRREELRRLGGPPPADRDPSIDPILYGPDPLARARAWMDRKRWPEAESEFDEVVKVWPEVGSFWAERGRFYHRLTIGHLPTTWRSPDYWRVT
jgi:hypothetical protein